MTFGQLLLQLRTRAFLSQEELGRRSGLSPRAIRDLETGRVRRPRAASVRLLADSLELTSGERQAFEQAALGRAVQAPPGTQPPPDTQPPPGIQPPPDTQPPPDSALLDPSSLDPASLESVQPASASPVSPALDPASAGSAPVDPARIGSSAVAPALDPHAADLLNRLARWLQEQWLQEINARELGRDAIDLYWQISAQTREADRLWRPLPEGVGPTPMIGPAGAGVRDRTAGSDPELYELYAALPSGRLVIRAGAGAGKSSALLLLVAKALHQRQVASERDRAALPVPILLSVAEWDPQEADLIDFALQIATRDITFLRGGRSEEGPLKELIRSGRVALFLDGLDEMAAIARPMAIARINAASQVRMVLTSRPAEYQSAVAQVHLAGAAVVDLLPVSQDAARSFIKAKSPGQDDAWNAVLARTAAADLGTEPALNTPLYLSLMVQLYRTGSPAELLDEDRFPSGDAIANHLIDAIVPQAYSAHRPGPPPDRAQEWLRFVARRMTIAPDGTPLDRPSPELAWSQVSEWTPAWLPKLVYGLGFGLLVTGAIRLALIDPHPVLTGPGQLWGVAALWGVAGAVTYLFTVALDLRLTRFPVMGLSVGDASAVMIGLLGGLLVAIRLSESWSTPVWIGSGLLIGVAAGIVLSLVIVRVGLRDPRLRSRRKWPSSFGLSSPSWVPALMIAAPSAVFLLARRDVSVWEVITVVVVFVIGVFSESVLSAQGSDHGPPSARQSLRHDLMAWSALGVFAGIFAGLLLSSVFGTDLLVLPAWFAIIFCIPLLSSHAGAYLLAVTYLWATGKLPLTPLRFLDDAWRRGVIRRNGWRYAFRHQLLLQRLSLEPSGVEPRGGLSQRGQEQ